MFRGGAACWAVLLVVLVACQPTTAPASRGLPTDPATTAVSDNPAPSTATSNATGARAAASAEPTAPAVRSIPFALTTVSGSIAPIWVAVDQGVLRRYGIDLDLVSMSPAAVNQALIAGNIALATSGGSAVSAYVGGATDLVFIGGLMNKAHFKIMGTSEIARIEDLRGKTAGSSTAGSGASMALFETLRRFGLEPHRDVEIVYLREQPNIVSGLVTGAIQGAVLAPPFTDQVQSQGARVLVDMREFGIDLAGTNITTTRDFLRREPALARAFLMAWVETMQFVRDHPAETVESILRGTRSTDRAQAEDAYATFRDLWSPWLSEPAITTILNNLDEPSAKTARPADMIDDRILRELERSGWLAAHYTGP
jgi:NitT/TauT family transport system substrate-binding protein